QLEAAIQSVHAQRVRTGETDWEAVTLLYEGLLRHAPTMGARVAHAAALGEARDAEAGLGALDAIPPDEVGRDQPSRVVRGHVLAHDRRLGARQPAVRARERGHAPPVGSQVQQ